MLHYVRTRELSLTIQEVKDVSLSNLCGIEVTIFQFTIRLIDKTSQPLARLIINLEESLPSSTPNKFSLTSVD